MSVHPPEYPVDDGRRWRRLLDDVTAVFLDHAGVDEVEPLREVAVRVAAALGGWCGFALVADTGLVRPVVAEHPDPRRREQGRQACRLEPSRPHASAGPAGRPRAPVLERAVEGFSRALGLADPTVVPLRAGGEPLGILLLASDFAAGLDGLAGRAFAHALASHASLVVRNARLARALDAERADARGRAAGLEAVLDAHPAGLALIGPDQRLQAVNARLAALLPVPAARLVGRRLDDLDLAADLPERATAADELRAFFGPDAGELEVHGPDPRILQRTSSPLRGADGACAGRLVLLEDVTFARDLDRQRREFLSVASHELRTPLTTVSLYLQAASRRLRSGVGVDEKLIDGALRQSRRLGVVIDDLLSLSHLESGRLDLEVRALDLDAFVRGVASDEASTTARAVEVSSPGEGLVVLADPVRLGQVLGKLLQNAFKYSPPAARVRVVVERSGDFVTVSVCDEGIGVPRDELGQLFRPFFRGRNAGTTSFGGLGLGLHLSHEIVRRHAGRIEVSSVEGRGATFRLVLPLAPPAVGVAAGRRRVLVVDDDASLVEALRAALLDEGCDVEAAREMHALAALEAQRPDLLLVDVARPFASGREFVRQVRARDVSWRLPVVVVSAERDTEAQARRLDADGWMQKPLDAGRLAALVTSLLARPAPPPPDRRPMRQ